MSSSNSSDPFAGFKLWYYTPSIVAGAIFAAIFAILTCLHIFRLIRSRTWFCIPFIVGALFETIGYAARAAAHSDTKSLTPYIIQSILILIAPALLAASIYMILGRIILATRAESHSLIRISWLTKIFVTSDVLCFFIQSAGGGLIAKAKTQADVKSSENIILGGLILQIVIFGVFVAVAAVFHSRLRKVPTSQSQNPDLPWERYMFLLYTVSVLIAVRNIFRVIEYGTGNTGYLLTHEWTLYVFDAILMAAVLGICLVWYVPSIRPVKRRSGVQSLESEESQPLERVEYRVKGSHV